MQMYCQQVPMWTRSHVRCLLLSCDDRVKAHFAKISRIFLTCTSQPLLVSYGPDTYHLPSSFLLPLILWSSLLASSDWWILCILGITRLQQEHKMMSFSIDSVIFITSSCTLTLSEHFCWSCHIRCDVTACSVEMTSLCPLCPVEMTSSCPLCPVEMASICTLSCWWDLCYIPLGLCIWSGLCYPIWALM